MSERIFQRAGSSALLLCLPPSDSAEGWRTLTGAATIRKTTDAVRFAYLLLHKGRWGDRQLAPAEYIAMCGRPSPYNPHSPMGLMFEVNADGHVFGAPRDAFFKSGAGGSAIYVVPSLDLVAYKMAASDAQLDPDLTGLPVTYQIDHSRD